MVDAAHAIDHKIGLPPPEGLAVGWAAEIIAGIAPRPTRPAAKIAAEVREALTSALHGQALPEGVACHLPPALRAAATPAACHLLTGKKSVIEAVLASIIDAPAT